MGRENQEEDDSVWGGFHSLVPIGRVVGVAAAIAGYHVHC